MSDSILPAFAVLIAALAGLGVLGGYGVRAGRVGRAVYPATACLAGFGAILALLPLISDTSTATLVLPFGPPGQPLHLELDALASGLLCLSFVAGTAIAIIGEDIERKSATGPATLPLSLAGLALAVLAADAFALAAGLALAAAALGMSGHAGRGRTIQLSVTLFASVGLVVALALFSPPGTAIWFAAIRTTPPDPARATAGFLCALAATGTLAGLVPLHAWLPTALHEPRPTVTALFGGIQAPIVFGVLLRIGLELSGPAPPLWWGLLAMGLGAATAVLAGWRAAAAHELDSAVASGSQRQAGLAAMALGLALVAKAADLPDLAAIAVAALLLLLATQALCAPLTILAAAIVQRAAGSRRLDRIGGLIHFMPLTTTALLAGLAGMTALPATAAFAGFYLLFQAVLAGPRGTGLAPSLVFALAALVLAVVAALGVTAAVRLAGLTCLGAPRTPRAAAAQDVARPVRTTLLTLAGTAAALGLLPGVALRLLAEPAIRQLTGADLDGRAGLLHLAAAADAPGYAPLPLAALIALCGSCMLWLQRRRGLPSGEPVRAWQDGFAPPPAWMPFGDPLTQASGTGFLPTRAVKTPPFRPSLGKLPNIRRYYRRTAPHQLPILLLAVFALGLAALVCLGAT